MAVLRRRVRVMGLVLAGTTGALGLTTPGCGSSPGDPAAVDAGHPSGAGGSLDAAALDSGMGGRATSTGSGGASGSGGATMTGGASGTAGAGVGGSGTGGGLAATGGRTGTGGMNGASGAGGAAGAANITLWLAGDSTMATGGPTCPIGWGGKFQAQFNARAKVTNSAVSGTSVNDWLYDVSASPPGADGECLLNSTTFQPGWTAMLNGMKSGDYLFVQFGINDTDPTCPKHESTDRFKTDLGMMAQAARDRGANPIFLSSVSSIACTGSNAIPTRGRFATAAREAAVTYNVPLIDLEQLSVALYTSLGFCPLPGPDAPATFASGPIGNFFCTDHTHFESDGATQIANLVAQAVKDQGFALASYLMP